MNTHKFNRSVGQISILAGFFAILSIYLTAAGAGFNTAVFSNPKLLLGMTTADAQALKWGMMADMFGYYLLLLPALFYFHQYLKTRTAWSYLLTWCGSAYILIGSAGAVILGVIVPPYISEYQIATIAQQEIIARNFDLVNQMVYGGMWNILEVLLAGTWWLGLGMVIRKEQNLFSTLTIVLGAASILDGLANMAGLHQLAQTGLNVYMILAIAWPMWFGIQLVSKRKNAAFTRLEKQQHKEEIAFA